MGRDEMKGNDTSFGDLNGPLMYWGPAVQAQEESGFSPAEQAVLLRLRARLEGAGSGIVSVTEAIDTLIDASQLAGATV